MENKPNVAADPGEMAKSLSQIAERSQHLLNEYLERQREGKIAPMSDEELYGKPEYWTIPTDAGDCEDYLLLKKHYLEGLGFPSDALLITVVLDEKLQGHAVLTIATDKGDFVLDNRRNDVLRWSDTGYSFLKRQSAEDPRQWVSLTKKDSVAGQVVSAGAKTK